jgi:hypothetical protein
VQFELDYTLHCRVYVLSKLVLYEYEKLDPNDLQRYVSVCIYFLSAFLSANRISLWKLFSLYSVFGRTHFIGWLFKTYNWTVKIFTKSSILQVNPFKQKESGIWEALLGWSRCPPELAQKWQCCAGAGQGSLKHSPEEHLGHPWATWSLDFK